MRRLIRAALINRAVPSFLRLSIPCINGTRGLRSVMLIFSTWNPIHSGDKICLTVGGSLVAGPSRIDCACGGLLLGSALEYDVPEKRRD